MKIAIDISQIVYETGVSWYTKNLVENLLQIDTENEYLLYGGSLRRKKELKNKIQEFSGNYQAKVFFLPPTVADLVWNRWHTLKVENLIGKVDVLHSSDWTQPPSKAFKVTTVHDLALFKFPGMTHRKVIAAHKRRLSWVKKEVDRIIVPSKSTVEDLVDMGFEKKKIRIIPEAPSKVFKKTGLGKVREVKKKYGIEGDYLFCVGVGGRKNTGRTIKAFGKLGNKELKLVFVGRAKNFPSAEGVQFLGHVEWEDLPALYSGAEALVYPSLYEGFGLPILEAMACGTPVITSNTSSLPQVAGKAAILVDPKKVDSIATGIRNALRNKKELTRKGLARAKQFSWEKTARETLEVYMEGK